MSAASETSLLELLHSILRLRKVGLVLWTQHLKPAEAGLLRQVAYNILFNSSFRLGERDKVYFKRRLPLLRRIASRRISTAEKRSLLAKKPLFLKRLAVVAREYLREGERG